MVNFFEVAPILCARKRFLRIKTLHTLNTRPYTLNTYLTAAEFFCGMMATGAERGTH